MGRTTAGIQTATLILRYNDWNTRVGIPQGDKAAPEVFRKQQRIVFADSSYFGFFLDEWVEGSPTTDFDGKVNKGTVMLLWLTGLLRTAI